MAFRRRNATPPQPPPHRAHSAPARPPAIVHAKLTIVDDTSDFEGDNGDTFHVHGFKLFRHRDDGSTMELYRNDHGVSYQQLYNFKVAGVRNYHSAEAQSRALCPMSAVTLSREPDNEYDPNAIKVVGRDFAMAGYVPRGAAAALAAIMELLQRITVPGLVTKTYKVNGQRIGLEVFTAVDWNVELVGSVNDESRDSHGRFATPDVDDLWRSGK